MRYFPLILAALVLIALDGLALYRITQGQGGPTAWIVIGASGLILGVMLGMLLRKRAE